MLFIIYLLCGVFGFITNCLVLGPLIKISSYHKSVYVLLASIVLCDICTCLMLGCWAGLALLFKLTLLPESVICFICICCQFVTILTYVALSVFLCRCTGKCRSLPSGKTTWCHRTEVAIGICILIWIMSITAGMWV